MVGDRPRPYLVLLFFLIGIGQKLYYAYRLSGYADGDPATIGLIAQDILNGRFNIFFYGQNFNGPLEAFWLAPFIWLFGLKTFVLFCGMIALYAIFLLTIYKLGGIWALAYCAVSTYPLLHNSVFPYGYHMSILVLGNLLLILALSEKRLIHWVLLGLVAGLGFWNHFIIIYYLVPIAIFLRRAHIASIVCFFIGSLPFWFHNLQTNFSSFHIRDGRPYRYYPVDITFWQSVKSFFGYHFSGILGIQEFNIFGYIIWGIFIISVFVFFLRLNKKKFLFLLLLFSIIGFGLSQRFFVTSPKYCYFLPLYTVTSICFAYLAEKMRYVGIALLLFNMGNFTISTSEGKPVPVDYSVADNYKSLIKFMDLNGINGVIGDFHTVQALNFMTNKRIAGAELLNGRPPTDELVASRDKIAILDCPDFIKSSMDAICREYKITDNIAYGFNRYDYYGRAVNMDDWKARSKYNNKDIAYSFDRNIDRFWSTGKYKEPGMFYELDMGRTYRIYRLLVFNISPHLNNLPNAYRIKVSRDGVNWDIINFGKEPQPLFWSGPRPYWDYYNGRWEVIFKPVNARFIRIEQRGYGKWAWMINELFVYEYLGGKEYADPPKGLYEYLRKEGVRFVYADFWLSAKIRELGLETIRIMNECYPKRYTSRLMESGEDTAIVIDKAEEIELERLLEEFELPFDKVYFGDYICYRFKKLNPVRNKPAERAADTQAPLETGQNYPTYCIRNEKFLTGLAHRISNGVNDRQRCLYWLGTTMAKTNMSLYKQILARDRGHYLPKIGKEVVFKNGIRFLGFRLFRFGNRLRVYYFWKIPKKIPEGLVVFVHFTKDGKIIFQGDHPLSDLISLEKHWVDIPPDIEHGLYKIYLGLYMPDKKGKRIKIGKATKAEIGEIVL